MVRLITVLDLAAVAAVLLLLVGAPSYIAAGPVARSIPSDGIIEIPRLHVGDQASFILVVTTPDGTSHRSAPLLELTVERAVDPYSSRAGFALNWTQIAANASVGPIDYATEAATTWYRWRDDGVPGMGEVVTQRRPGAGPTSDGLLVGRQGRSSEDAATFDGTPWRDTYMLLAPRDSAALQPLPYTQVQYHPAGLEAILHRLEQDADRLLGDPPQPTHEALVRSFLAAEYDDRLLLGVAPREYTNKDPFFASENGQRIYGPPASRIVLDHPLATNMVRTDPPILWDRAVSWSWVSPSLGAAAGFHQELQDRNGEPLLTIDLLPSSITHGDGKVAAAPQATAPAFTPPTASHSWTTLGALHADTRRLHQNLSLADIAAHLESDAAPETIRSFMAADAYFGGYAFQPGTTSDKLLPLPTLLPGSRDPLRISTGTWHVILLRDNGAVQVARLEISEAHEAGDHVVSVSDVCEAQRSAFFTYDCTPLEASDAFSRERAIADPLMLRADFVERHAAHGHEHLRVDHFYLPLYRIVERGYAADPMSPSPSYWDGMETGGVGWRAIAPQGGLMNLHYGTSRDRYDLATSARLFSHEREVADDAPPVSPMAGQAAPAPRVVAGADARLILTGIVLFAAAIVTRAVMTFWMHLLWLSPGWLYSRIPQEKVLKNTRRQAALQAVTDEPGMSLSEVSERLDLAWGTTVHHLRTLERAGLVTSLAEGRSRHFFPTGSMSPVRMRLLLAHRKPVYRDLLVLVESNPGISLSEAAGQLDRDLAGTSRTGTRLARMAALTKRRVAGKVCFYPVSPSGVTEQVAKSTKTEPEVRTASPSVERRISADRSLS